MLTLDSSLPRTVLRGEEYTATPSGWILSHCVWETASSALASAPLPPCVSAKGNPVLLTQAQAQHRGGDVKNDDPTPNPLPPDYDGWLQYAAFNNTAGFDSMTNKMSVPDAPSSRPQILYLFPGLQNIDWIPAITPEPMKAHFDIIQPVLQYPYLSADAEAGAGDWGLRSWYVTVDSGAKMSTEIIAPAGDVVLCNMTKTGADGSWIIDAALASSGKRTTQAVTESRLITQPWAYVTVECYGCKGCSTYPQKPLLFTELALTKDGAAVPSIAWRANPKPQPKQQCKEATKIISSTDITVTFQ